MKLELEQQTRIENDNFNRQMQQNTHVCLFCFIKADYILRLSGEGRRILSARSGNTIHLWRVRERQAQRPHSNLPASGKVLKLERWVTILRIRRSFMSSPGNSGEHF